MRNLLLALCILCTLRAPAQQAILKHTFYTSYFNEKTLIPDSVVYDLTADMLNCETHIARTNRFTADPLLPEYTNLKRDYVGSGYDQGHNFSAEDASCDATDMTECFYFSNMMPQTPADNRGIWKQIENKERALVKQYGSVHVKIWHTGVSGYIGVDSVLVPAYCWKAISYHIAGSGNMVVYKVPNTDEVSGAPGDFEVK